MCWSFIFQPPINVLDSFRLWSKQQISSLHFFSPICHRHPLVSFLMMLHLCNMAIYFFSNILFKYKLFRFHVKYSVCSDCIFFVRRARTHCDVMKQDKHDVSTSKSGFFFFSFSLCFAVVYT